MRISRRMAKREPHLFGPHAADYFLDTLHEQQGQRELEIAINRVYGTTADGLPQPSTRWTDRYVTWPAQRFFRKWFKERYGS